MFAWHNNISLALEIGNSAAVQVSFYFDNSSKTYMTFYPSLLLQLQQQLMLFYCQPLAARSYPGTRLGWPRRHGRVHEVRRIQHFMIYPLQQPYTLSWSNTAYGSSSADNPQYAESFTLIFPTLDLFAVIFAVIIVLFHPAIGYTMY
jgi:hypothetical protein